MTNDQCANDQRMSNDAMRGEAGIGGFCKVRRAQKDVLVTSKPAAKIFRGEVGGQAERGHSCPQQLSKWAGALANSNDAFRTQLAADKNVRAPA